MTVRQLSKLILGRWPIVLIAMLLGFVAAVGWAKLSTKVYRASAQVIVSVRAPETLGTQSLADQLSPDYLSTQLDVIQSDRVAAAVVQKLHLASNLKTAASFGWSGRAGSVEQFLAQRLKGSLRVEAGAGMSRVIAISFSSSDPQFAAAIANSFAQAYQEISLDLQAEPARATAEWYQNRVQQQQAELAAAQARVSAKQRELSVTGSNPQQPSADESRLLGLSTQLAVAQAEDAATRARVGSPLPASLANPVVQNLQADLARLEAQRQQLSVTAGPNNPDYRQIVSQIAGLRQQLATQRALVQNSQQQAAAQSGAAVAQLTAALAGQKRRMIDTKTDLDQVDLLQQDVKARQAVYDQMAARRSQLDLLGESEQSNVAILSPAVPPTDAIWPKTTIMAAGGALVGGLVGALAALGLGLLNQRLRGPKDFETWLGIVNLGSVRLAPPAPYRLVGRYFALPFLGARDDGR